MERWAKRRLNPEVPPLAPEEGLGGGAASTDRLSLQLRPACLILSALAHKPLSRDTQCPDTPKAEQLGTVIYGLRKERLPGAELSNFWRNIDNEIGIGLRTGIEKKSQLRATCPQRPLLCWEPPAAAETSSSSLICPGSSPVMSPCMPGRWQGVAAKGSWSPKL